MCRWCGWEQNASNSYWICALNKYTIIIIIVIIIIIKIIIIIIIIKIIH